MMVRCGDISIRLMEDCPADYVLVSKWLSDPCVLDYYEGRDNPYDLDRVVAKYSPRILGQAKVTPCIFQYDDLDIGYIQYYEPTEEEKGEYGYDGQDGIFGVDLFIGETGFWNMGLGAKVLTALVEFLRTEKHAHKVIIDPQTGNVRAIRCYEKCGFSKVKVLEKHEVHEGEHRDNWLMEVRL